MVDIYRVGVPARWYKHRMPGKLAAREPSLRASLRRGGVLTAATLLALTWTASSAQAVPTWLAPQTTSSPTAAPVGIEPAMTMGPGGEIAAASWTAGGEIVADVRPAGAASFTHEAVSTPADEAVLPSVAVNATGAVAVAWYDATAEQYEVAIRPPGGIFSTPIDAGPTGGATPQASSVAIDDAGDVLVGETREAVGGDVAVYAWIPAGGAFTATTVSEPEGEASRPVVAMNGAGDAIVAWDDKGSGPRDIARAVTRPAGSPFGLDAEPDGQLRIRLRHHRRDRRRRTARGGLAARAHRPPLPHRSEHQRRPRGPVERSADDLPDGRQRRIPGGRGRRQR